MLLCYGFQQFVVPVPCIIFGSSDNRFGNFNVLISYSAVVSDRFSGDYTTNKHIHNRVSLRVHVDDVTFNHLNTQYQALITQWNTNTHIHIRVSLGVHVDDVK